MHFNFPGKPFSINVGDLRFRWFSTVLAAVISAPVVSGDRLRISGICGGNSRFHTSLEREMRSLFGRDLIEERVIALLIVV